MSSLYDVITEWARRTTTSFSDIVVSRFQKEAATDVNNDDDDDRVFRLKQWPVLPDDQKTLHVYRALSVMTSRPVNRRWLLAHTKLVPSKLDELLERLVAEGSIQVIDPSRFHRR